MAAKVYKFNQSSISSGTNWYSGNVSPGFFSNNSRLQNGLLLVNYPAKVAGDRIFVQGTFDKTTPWANVFNGLATAAVGGSFPGQPISDNADTTSPFLHNYMAELPGLPPVIRVHVEGPNAATTNVWIAFSDS